MNYINPPKVQVQGVHHRTFYSRIYKHDIGYSIYLPDNDASGDRRYPVAYHFHGWMGNESSEIQAMEKVCRGRKAITVFVNHAHVNGDVKDLPVAPMFIQELLPHIDSLYQTVSSREGRTVSGFSMGGGIAARLAFRYPDLFSALVAYAGTYHHYFHKDYLTVGTPVEQAAEIYRTMMREEKFFDGNVLCEASRHADSIRGQLKISLHVGTGDVLYCDNEILHLHLNALQIPHEYRLFEGADHALEKIL